FREGLLMSLLSTAGADPQSRVYGDDPRQLRARLIGRTDVERHLEASLRLGPFGDGFGRRPRGVTLQRPLAHPEGIDFGPMVERIDEVIAHPDGVIDICPEVFAEELEAMLEAPLAQHAFLLVGRRQLRSNNSWLHNLPKLTAGRNECTLLMN